LANICAATVGFLLANVRFTLIPDASKPRLYADRASFEVSKLVIDYAP